MSNITHLPILIVNTYANEDHPGILHQLQSSARNALNASKEYTVSEKGIRTDIDSYFYPLSAASVGNGTPILSALFDVSANQFYFISLSGNGMIAASENAGNIFLDSIQEDTYSPNTSATVIRRYLNGGTQQTITTIPYDSLTTSAEVAILPDLTFGDSIGKTLIKCVEPFIAISGDLPQFSVGTDADHEALIKSFNAPSTSGLVDFTYGDALLTKSCIIESTDNNYLKWPQNWFGDESDGDLSISGTTLLSSLIDSDSYIVNANSLTITSGATLSVSNRCKALVIYVKGNLVNNGVISMTGKGAFVNPDTASVGENGLEIIRFKHGYYDIANRSIVDGFGTEFINSEKNQPGSIGNIKRYLIRKYGANSMYNGPYISDTVSSPKNATGNSGLQKSGSGQPGTVCAPAYGSYTSIGMQGTCFSGGTGGGSVHTSETTTLVSTGALYGGQGGNGLGNLTTYGGTGTTAGSGTVSGNIGTGGTIIIIVGGSIVNNGTIEANGVNGVYSGSIGGGASGGGNILVLYGNTITGTETIIANGGIGPGGLSAGNGSVQIDKIDSATTLSINDKFKLYRNGSVCTNGKMQILTFFDRLPKNGYMFDCSNSSSIARCDVSTNMLSNAYGHKSISITNFPIAAASNYVYTYGGYTTAIVNSVLKFNPINDVDGAYLRTSMFQGVKNASCSTDKSVNSFIFGGELTSLYINTIGKHSITNDTTAIASVSYLIEEKSNSTAKMTADNQYTFIFGGQNSASTGLTNIDKFTSATYTIAAINAGNLLAGVTKCGAYNGVDSTYVYGGQNNTTTYKNVQKIIWSTVTVSNSYSLIKNSYSNSNIASNTAVLILNDNLIEKIELSNETYSFLIGMSPIHSGNTSSNAGTDFTY